MDQQIEQVHPEVVEIGERADFFAVARKVLPWVALAFVLFRVGALAVEFQNAQRVANLQATSAAAPTAAASSQGSNSLPSAATAKAVPAARGPYVVVLSDGVNFHASAANSGKVIGSLKRGAELSQLGRVGNWLKLKDAAGTVGYAYDNPKLLAHKN
jgi:hypothetical protein